MFRDVSDGPSEVEQSPSHRVIRPRRCRWYRVRVETDEGAYLGLLRLDGGRSTLHDALDDGRVYLALWDAVLEASREPQGFLVIHKASIRQVALLGPGGAPAGSGEEA